MNIVVAVLLEMKRNIVNRDIPVIQIEFKAHVFNLSSPLFICIFLISLCWQADTLKSFPVDCVTSLGLIYDFFFSFSCVFGGSCRRSEFCNWWKADEVIILLYIVRLSVRGCFIWKTEYSVFLLLSFALGKHFEWSDFCIIIIFIHGRWYFFYLHIAWCHNIY